MKQFLIVICFILIKAYDRGSHRLDVVVEKFQFRDYYFIFYSKAANWDEAYTICQATNSRLAVVNTLERANFLAEALSQTKIGFEDMWIGGHFVKDSWQWVPTGKSFSKSNDTFPPWLNYPTQRGKNCLALDRKNHWDPIFVELKCHLYRPFICEESVSGSMYKHPEESTNTYINGRSYTLYHARVTWQEALVFCTQTDNRLAIIPDLDTATKLAELMKRSRPPFENVWIGARKELLGWTWTATDKMLPNKTQLNGFPPWRFDHPVDPMKTCLILDHHPCLNIFHMHTYRPHRCEEAVFIEEHCTLKKDFLCESGEDKPNVESKTDLVTVDMLTYIFYKDLLPWADAMFLCEEINMTLAMPQTKKQWDTIILHMADMNAEFDHIWLGGRWIPDEWVWLDNSSIPLPNPNRTFPPWCNCSIIPLHEDELDCLNLDRDAHSSALIYGYNCSVPQPFVCQLDVLNAIRTSIPHEDFEIHSSGLTHAQAESACKQNKSDLAVVNNFNLAQQVALLLPRDSFTWIGGRRIESVWRWLKTKEIIPDNIGKDNYPPWESYSTAMGESMCLAMKSGYREQPFFVEIPCREKLPYLCQFAHKELQQPDSILTVNGIKYYFYNKGVPWNTALSRCNSGGLHLINVGNLELGTFLLEGMRDNIPIWTSGKQMTPGSWTWITSGTKLPNIIKYGYPPWGNNKINDDMEKSCLMLDKTNELPVFVGEDCFQNHSFVCVDKIPMFNKTEIQMNNITINLQTAVTNIRNAKEACLKNGENMADFSKLNNTNLYKLFQSEKIKSLWVDVVLNVNNTWVYPDTNEEFHTEINFPDRNNISVNDPKRCLTLQLTPQQKLILKPSLCSDFSRIICMPAEQKVPILPKVDHVINETARLTAIFKNMILAHASLTCNDIGGVVINGPFVPLAVEFFKTLQTEYRNFWIEAHFENGLWHWKDNTTVKLDNLPKASEAKFSNKVCLIYNRDSNKFEAADCSSEHSTVCQQVNYTCEPLVAKNQLQWFPKKCTASPLKAGTVCHAKCPPQLNLIGPEVNICSKGKWSQLEKQECRAAASHSKSLYQLICKYIRQDVLKSYFVFILDMGIKKQDYIKLLQFTKSLGNLVLLNNYRKIALELYSFSAKAIDILENNNCYFMYTIDRLISTPIVSNSLANYMDAFLTAEEILTAEDVQYDNAFIFFFAFRKDFGSMNRTKIINRLKSKGVVFIVIAVGDDINRSQLEEIASSKYNGLQLYTFSSMKGLRDAGNQLKKKDKVGIRDCPRGLRV